MKKIACALLCAGLACSAQAEDQSIQEAAKASFSGIYFGGGVHFMNYQNEAVYLNHDGDQIVRESNEASDSKGRLGGTVVLGIGKKLQSIPFYFALEGMLDFAPVTRERAADKVDGETEAFYSTTVKRNCLIPSVGIRLAWASDCLQALAYLKVAASFSKDSYKHSEYFAEQRDYTGNIVRTADWVVTEVKNSRVCPEVTIGLEKRFGKVGMRLETGYAFGCGDKKVHISKNVDGIPDLVNDEIRLKKKGSVVLRMMAIMNLNVFN